MVHIYVIVYYITLHLVTLQSIKQLHYLSKYFAWKICLSIHKMLEKWDS